MGKYTHPLDGPLTLKKGDLIVVTYEDITSHDRVTPEEGEIAECKIMYVAGRYINHDSKVFRLAPEWSKDNEQEMVFTIPTACIINLDNHTSPVFL